MPRKPKEPSLPTQVESIKHAKDTRSNTPTAELSGWVAEDELAPKTLLYPRDPSLDPQLVWKDKDEQDSHDLGVPSVPIYIQEKIHPQAIMESLRTESDASRNGSYQYNLFADFNGISFEQMVEFYQHEQHWSNRMILGDSKLVMASLADKEHLRGQVQMIYIDPPYGIKFGSNWQVSTRKRDVKDSRAEDMTRQPEQIRAFRDTWELGIHSYLAYLRDRLVLAHDLLSDSGSVFIQIGDENVHLVRCLLDEVFGSENYCSFVIFRKTTTQSGDLLPDTNDYLLWYAKQKDKVKYRTLYQAREGGGWVNYDYVRLPDGTFRKMMGIERAENGNLPGGSEVYRRSPLVSTSSSQSTLMPVLFQGKTYLPGTGGWKTNMHGFYRLAIADRLESYGVTLSYRRYTTDFPFFPLSNSWTDTASGGYGEDKVYVVQTNSKVIERCLLMTTDPGDLVLDPTMGSATTAYVAEQWGRRWITIDTSRVALALARTRLMAARYPYYLLLDSVEGKRKESEVTGQMPSDFAIEDDVKKGFVYKRVPHVTLKSIANNAEMDAIYEQWQEELEPARAELNQLLGEEWKEWQIPREANDAWSAEAKRLLAEWWRLRHERQKAIDASIARRAETELLYDQPYEDPKRVRVTGPFTVESLSPHRVASMDEDQPKTEATGETQDEAERFVATILVNMKRAGVQNTKKGERIVFDMLEPHTGGEYLQALGEYTEQGGAVQRVAVCIGPKYGTVSTELIRDAAKEAMRGVGVDMLLVCGFAFDPYVSEDSKQMGRLRVLPVRMNPDLTMADDLLKKTSAANLFTVFGEPDVTVSHTADGKVVVEVHGVDIYNPTTGEIRSSTTDDIACWFVDTDYNEESFFVKHAYFTGADQPYEKLKRSLRAEIDEAAWASLYSTKSRPFPTPKTGKIAVKVINHYGDEVLKVYTT